MLEGVPILLAPANLKVHRHLLYCVLFRKHFQTNVSGEMRVRSTLIAQFSPFHTCYMHIGEFCLMGQSG